MVKCRRCNQTVLLSFQCCWRYLWIWTERRLQRLPWRPAGPAGRPGGWRSAKSWRPQTWKERRRRASSSALPNGLTSRYLFHPAQQQHPVEFTKTGKTRQTYWEKEIRAQTRKCLNQLVASNTCLDHKRSINDGTKAFFHWSTDDTFHINMCTNLERMMSHTNTRHLCLYVFK